MLFLKGMGMGGADVVPGVSGGTIALITGIYEELIDSIKSLNLDTVKLLLAGKIADFWKAINGTFLLVLFAGIATSLLSLARLITFLMETYPIQLWSFFFGLIIISAIYVAKEIANWTVKAVIALVLGALIAYLITVASPAETPTALWFIFISGAIAICAMILPGISGSFILLILGKYIFIITALKEADISVIAVFGIGCVVGLLSFARVISWLLSNYHTLTIAVLAGFMIGSLNKIWPWKIPTSYRVNSEGEQVPLTFQNLSPTHFLETTGEDPYILEAILFFAMGIAIVVVLEKVAQFVTKDRKAVAQ